MLGISIIVVTHYTCAILHLAMVSLATGCSSSAAPSSGLFFTLNGIVYLPGDTVLITDIGEVGLEDAQFGRADPGRSLVCATRNINTQCCRRRFTGQWHFPNGSKLLPLSFSFSRGFVRRAFTREVRLERRNNAMSPTGKYECRVPHELTGELVNASITLTTG